MAKKNSIILQLISVAGPNGIDKTLAAIQVPPALHGEGKFADRAQVAMALNIVLLADLLERVPTAAAYVADLIERGELIHFDHGALRTIDGPTGSLPAGTAAFARLLGPLGYHIGGIYPLPRLRMTGAAFVHRDLPESIPQFFVSELHLAQLPEEAQTSARNVFDGSVDPLDVDEQKMLGELAKHGRCPLELAMRGLPGLVRAFGRQHPLPAWADYERLLAHSAEAAWIATEGNAFNHATDRVPDVEALATALRAQGFPLKPEIEISANGRVRQTAFVADQVMRTFRLPDGSVIERKVPGSFFEFISRDLDPATGRLDLGFDSGNATGIFAVTSAR